MANSEKLGTCEQAHGSKPHKFNPEVCVNWCEQPQEPTVASPRSGMGAREFAAEHVEWLQRITPTGSSKAENDPFAFAEAYAADQVRQADQQSLVDNEQLNDEILALQAEVAQLQQERDALKFQGKSVTIGDTEYVMPSLSVKQAKEPLAGATAGTARELLIEKLAKALWNQEIADEVKTSGKPAEYFAQWPEDSRIQPYCRRTYRQAEAVTNIAEAYADERVRQLRPQIEEELFTHCIQHQQALEKAEAEIAELRQERDDDEQMWRERCAEAAKAGYEVAMEQEREARERVEGALREIVHSVGKLAEESGEDWRLKHAELMDAYEAGVLAVKSSEGEAK